MSATSAASSRRTVHRAPKHKLLRVTLTDKEKARANEIAPAVSLKDVIHGGVLASEAMKTKRRRHGELGLVNYDMGLSEDDIQRMKESYE